MSTKPVPRPPAETRKRQRIYLIGAAILLISLVAGTALMDAIGADRDENRARSNEERATEPAAR